MKMAFTGLPAWLVQRISAVFMLLFIAFVLAHFSLDPPRSYRDWHGWVTSPGVSAAILAFHAALSIHAWVGIRDVAVDYVRPAALRLATLALLGFGLVAVAAWMGRILWAGGG